MNSRRITLIVAVVLAVATGLLTLHYLSGVNQKVRAQVVITAPVVIASVDIPLHARIKPQMLAKVQRPANTIEPGTLSDASQAVGDVALATIRAGKPIVQTQVGEPATVGVAGSLRFGERAITIPVDMVKAVAGLLEPGDHVDVIASLGGATGSRQPNGVTIIRDATVLAINQQTSMAAAPSPPPIGAAPVATPMLPPSTVTLAVSSHQADLLTVADLNATLRLALRPPEEPKGSTPLETLNLASSGPPAASAPMMPPAMQPPLAGPRAPTASAARKEPVGIPVIIGDKLVRE